MIMCFSRVGRDLEQDFRDRLAALRSQSEQENEALLQQAERERRALQENLRLLTVQEAGLQEELCSATEVCTQHSGAQGDTLKNHWTDVDVLRWLS